MIKSVLERLLARQDLDSVTMKTFMTAVLNGEVTPSQTAAVAIALRMKQETAAEITAAAQVMREFCSPVRVDVDEPLLDTCGTGGDGLGTFNVSTAAAVLVAATGVKVAKHGNRAVSSRAGSADVLEALGVRLEQSPARVAEGVREVGIGFMFAPAHHSALKYAAQTRRELGVRTFFNLLGPICNPAGATHQLLGVYDARYVRVLAEVLAALGSRCAWVVHGEGGMDEVTPCGRTEVAAWNGTTVQSFSITPEDYGLERLRHADILGGDASANAKLMLGIFDGERSAYRTAVVLNAAVGLMVAGKETDANAARERIERVIDSGAARQLFERWRSFSNEDS